MVNRITVTFDGAVTIDAGAFELRRQDQSLVGLNVAVSLVEGQTVAVLTFTGPGIIGGSLADGNYTLTVQAERVHDRWGRELDGDADDSAGGDRADAFFRLFGDSDGDRDVDAADFAAFRGAFGGYSFAFDFDGDNDTDGADFGQFRQRFGGFIP